MKIEDIKKVNLKDRCDFLSGQDNWHTKELKEIKLGSVMMTDGPNGVRKELQAKKIGLNEAVKATAFPCNCLLGSTWDKEMAYKYGEGLGKEAKYNQVSMILGPGINIKRSPLCGRNFEYLSEDPYLTGLLASNYINGVQSTGVGCSLKHFAGNNQEVYRASIDSVIDPRALREIYLKGFEIAVKNSQPMSIMTSYNRINGVFSSSNKFLLQDIARKEWGFKGFFVSDWGGTADRIDSIHAGMSLAMPFESKASDDSVYDALKNGKITEEEVNNCVLPLANAVEYALKHVDKKYKLDLEDNHKLCKEIASDGIVLLKNEDVLPLNKEEKILYCGDFINVDKYSGGGSSHVNANHVVGIKDAVKDYKNIEFCRGYDLNNDEVILGLEEEATNKAKEVDKVVLYLGLSDAAESEGFDRTTLSLPKAQLSLVNKLVKVNPNVIVVLITGSPVLLPFKDEVKGIVAAYLGGEAFGEAIRDILFNVVNPSGKLMETFPKSIKNVPCYKSFPGGSNAVYYKESIFVGYRYYSTYGIDVTYPLGYGLSYTKFEYKNLNVHTSDKGISVSVKIKNVGKFAGKEVVELYVGGPNTTVFKPLKELKDFEKISLKAGEEKQVHFDIPFDHLSYYNYISKSWVIESGVYTFYVGGDASRYELSGEVFVKSNEEIASPYSVYATKNYRENKIHAITDKEFSYICNFRLPKKNMPIFKGFDDNASFTVVRHTIFGGAVYRALKKNKDLKKNPMVYQSVLTMPFRQIFYFVKGEIKPEEKQAFLDCVNGKLNKKNLALAKSLMSKLSM